MSGSITQPQALPFFAVSSFLSHHWCLLHFCAFCLNGKAGGREEQPKGFLLGKLFLAFQDTYFYSQKHTSTSKVMTLGNPSKGRHLGFPSKTNQGIEFFCFLASNPEEEKEEGDQQYMYRFNLPAMSSHLRTPAFMHPVKISILLLKQLLYSMLMTGLIVCISKNKLLKLRTVS